MSTKKLEDLTIKDNFMFGAVMLDPENCKGLIERVLDIEVEKVEVSLEKSIVYHPEYKGVRLDVFAKDEKNTHYNIEMQVERTPTEKRSRYYHSQMDMELLLKGTEYDELPESYVIFICDYDPLGAKKYKYTINSTCKEIPDCNYDDGCHTIILSTVGDNETEVPESLVKFLKFVRAKQSESEKDYEDEYIEKLQNSVKNVKKSRTMKERYMIFEEMLRKEWNEGWNEAFIYQIKRKLEKNKSLEQIAEEMELSVREIEKLIEEME